MTSRNYADDRAELLRELDGLRVEVDAARKVGHLILDRPPLNIVSYRGRSQIRALIEAMDEDDDIGVIVIRGANGVYTSGGDVKSFPQIPFDSWLFFIRISFHSRTFRPPRTPRMNALQCWQPIHCSAFSPPKRGQVRPSSATWTRTGHCILPAKTSLRGGKV